MELEYRRRKISGKMGIELPNDVLCEVATMDRINLNEFILHTVDAEKVIKYLISGWNFSTYEDFDAHENYGIVIYRHPSPNRELIQLWIREKDEETIKEIMGKMGWFCGARDLYVWNPKADSGHKFTNSGLFGLQFEKKYDNDETEDVLSEKYIYHYTSKSLVNKIKQTGLVPKMSSWVLFGGKGKDYTSKLYKNTSDSVNYGRIYFFKEGAMVNPEKYFASKTTSKEGKEYVLLRITTEKLPEGIKFYDDPKQSGAVFTYDNIPPEAIEVIEQ